MKIGAYSSQLPPPSLSSVLRSFSLQCRRGIQLTLRLGQSPPFELGREASKTVKSPNDADYLGYCTLVLYRYRRLFTFGISALDKSLIAVLCAWIFAGVGFIGLVCWLLEFVHATPLLTIFFAIAIICAVGYVSTLDSFLVFKVTSSFVAKWMLSIAWYFLYLTSLPIGRSIKRTLISFLI